MKREPKIRAELMAQGASEDGINFLAVSAAEEAALELDEEEKRGTGVRAATAPRRRAAREVLRARRDATMLGWCWWVSVCGWDCW